MYELAVGIAAVVVGIGWFVAIAACARGARGRRCAPSSGAAESSSAWGDGPSHVASVDAVPAAWEGGGGAFSGGGASGGWDSGGSDAGGACDGGGSDGGGCDGGGSD